jgi:hypothetical protein
MSKRKDPDEWTFEQRAAIAEDIQWQLEETLGRLMLLGQHLAAEITIANHLLEQQICQRLNEDEIPF